VKRRTVHKISPAQESTFDQQFWPVLVALTVLCGIALGAILTALRGPWLWGSLFVLPLLGAGAIFLLFHLDNQKLRRSLQFAIILSLALHLMVLVFASVVNIFQNPYQPNQRQVAQRQVRTIEISDRRAAFVWEKSNSRETPEPQVEPEKVVQPTTTTVKPQPIPVEERKPKVTPQLVRREKTSPSISRQNPELSELKKQKRPDVQPQSTVKTAGSKVATQSSPAKTKPKTNKTKSKPTKTTEKVESSKKADSLAKQSTVKPQPMKPAAAKSTPAPDLKPKPEVARTAAAPRRAKPAETNVESAPKASPSNANISRHAPDMPIATRKATASEKVASATTPNRTEIQPSKSANTVSRRPTKSRTTKPAMTNKPKMDLSPKSQVARTQVRRESNSVQPTIQTESSITMTPRRAVNNAKVATSPIQIEKPSRSPESKVASRELNSKTLSVSKSEAGVAGVGRSRNLDRFVGGINSPAARASDSARREQSTSRPELARMLASSQSAEIRRTTGSTPIPTSAFKAETSGAAKISGSKTPTDQTVESSAARINSRSQASSAEVSAERGSAAVDLGPTKVVMDRDIQRRSGGGQPRVSQLNPESTRRSKDISNLQPSLVAAAAADLVAPRNPSAMASKIEVAEASDKATFSARAGGKSAVTAERWAADIEGEFANLGKSTLAEQLNDARRRASRSEDISAWDDDEEDDEDELNLRGTRRTRIARAPVTRAAPGFGTAKSDGKSAIKATQAGDSPTESLSAKIQRQATSSLPGSGLGQTAANALLSAATSLPIIESSGASRRKGTGKSTNANADAVLAGIADPRGVRSQPESGNDIAPTISGSIVVERIKPNTTGDSTGEMELMESTTVSVDRSDLESLEQIQGSQLDIAADEGPAGLGVRPDNFIGVMVRPSSRESTQIQPDFDNRFKNEKFGGVPAINPDAVIAKKAFRNRSPAAMSNVAEPTTEAAIQLGLEFLARHQSPDGSWALNGFDRNDPQHISQLNSDTAATGLALLAFQGAGYNHREFKYAQQIDHAIQWLIENQSADGGLYVPSDKKSDNACRLYSHGIAALALTEAYGMTQDIRIKEAAQKAVDYIVNTQDARKGGWRYFDTPGKTSADTSVSGWMMMALQSARLAELKVGDNCFDGIDDWLDVAADPKDKSLYRYNPYAVDSKGVSRIQGRKPTAAMTSVGLLMRIYSGWEKDDPRLVAGAEYLLETQMPSDATPRQRDTYYWYYATQVLKHVDGPQWKAWNDNLRPLLTRSQEKSGEMAGSWHPYKPVPDRWGAFGGRIYVTTMNLLSLEVRHRMLPIYQQSDAPPEIVGIIETEAVSTNVAPKPVQPKKLVVKKPVIVESTEPVRPETKTQPEATRPEARMILEPRVRTAPQTKPANPKANIPLSAAPKTTPSAEIRPTLKLAPKPDVAVKPPAKKDPPKVEPKVDPPKTKPPIVLVSPLSKLGAVSGNVTFDRKVLKNAKIEFIPIDGKGTKAFTRTDAVGKFNITPKLAADGKTTQSGLKPGSYKVSVTTFVESPNENVIDFLETVPEKYNKKTTLKVDIVAGKRKTLDLKISSQ